MAGDDQPDAEPARLKRDVVGGLAGDQAVCPKGDGFFKITASCPADLGQPGDGAVSLDILRMAAEQVGAAAGKRFGGSRVFEPADAAAALGEHFGLGHAEQAGQPGAGDYLTEQRFKLQKYRRGLPAGPEADAVDALLQQMEDLLCP